MKILFVSANTNPQGTPTNGDGQRTCLLYEACKRIADVDVVSFEGQYDQSKPLGRLEKWMALLPFSSVIALFPVDPHREAVIDAAVEKGNYDFIVARYFFRAVACGLWKYREKLVIDFDDALPFFFLNQITPGSAWTSRIRLKWAAGKARMATHRLVRRVKAAFFAEESVARSNHGVFLPNIPYYSESCIDANMSVFVKRLLFVGQLEYPPNKEGLDHFLENVYLSLCERLPNVELHLVGVIQDEALRRRWQGFPGVTVKGFVDDLRREYEQSHVAVVPVYRCGATNIKILEAMMMNRACVTTREAYDKMHGQFENGKDLYAASSDEEFVEKLERLLTDSEENQRIAHNGKSVMDCYYSVDAFCEIVKKSIV